MNDVAELVEFGRALAIALASPWLVRTRPRRLERILEPSRPVAPHRREARDGVERALAVSARVVRHTCYTRGITRYYVLRRAGYPVSLVFGLDPRGRDGHCWILLNGRPYLEDEGRLDRFVPTWSIGVGR